ncbi:ATP-grasp domain-containing protein [Streptomyces spectabilis]|uniref:ATP-grasp domain-containing protein n=1 Tax=Streptomyces spectabilis TaxID=68270 RepID=A0A516RH71_STRST|nr:ATP-grasp domain-containing protein [Streptomyces spectabilis]QDQ15003.1 ATP-grasp domain-containing protein [Streptomyces spectabilis]
MTRQVLLLNSDKPEVLRALADRPDLRIRVITRKTYADLYAGHETAFVDSFEDLSQVERAAYELARGGPFDHVVAATEKSVVPAGLIRSLLGLRGPTFDQSLWAAHKHAMKTRLRSEGLPVADFEQTTTVDAIPGAARRIGWPVLVKPVFGSGAKCTYRLDSQRDFDARRDAGGFDNLTARRVPIQVERLVRFLREYHCDGVVRDGRVVVSAVSRYATPPLETPSLYNSSRFTDPESPFAEEIVALHARVVEALRLSDGVTHMEVFETAGGPVIGEVAIRPGGLGISRMWWHAHGIDLWEEFVRASLAEPSAPALRPQRDRVVGRMQLPAGKGVLEQALALPGVIEALPPERSGTGNVEVHYAARDDGAAERLNDRLRALGEPR